MEDLKEEMKNLMMVSLSSSISIGYCYFVGNITPKGLPRLLALIPAVLLLLAVPLRLTSPHLIGATSFSLSWLANFKLLLFAFHRGPLISTPFSRFFATACFPIKISPPLTTFPKSKSKSTIGYGVKGILLSLFLRVYYYHGSKINPMLAWFFLGSSIYFCLEIILVLFSKTVTFFLRVELDPQFHEPYLSTSLQDFWGRRWNIMVNRVLYPAVYDPVRKLSSRVMGPTWAPAPAIFTTFLVSGLMHEITFFYFTRDWPTWKMTQFFCLHGVSLVTELMIKKSVNGKWRLPRLITAPLVVVFVLVTSYWLFRPELLRCKMVERAFKDYEVVGKFIRDVTSTYYLKKI